MDVRVISPTPEFTKSAITTDLTLLLAGRLDTHSVDFHVSGTALKLAQCRLRHILVAGKLKQHILQKPLIYLSVHPQLVQQSRSSSPWNASCERSLATNWHLVFCLISDFPHHITIIEMCSVCR